MPVEGLLRRLAEVPGTALIASLLGREEPRHPAWQHRIDIKPLSTEESRRLFLAIASRIKLNDPYLAPMLAELGGIPLAIELAALQARLDEDLSDLWAAWENGSTSLLADPRGGAHRHASLERSILLSLDSPRLSEPGIRLFRLLGAMPAGVSRSDRDALMGVDFVAAVRQLQAVGLSIMNNDRYDLRPPIRRFARKHYPLLITDLFEIAKYFLVLIVSYENNILTRGADAVNRLRPELPNIETIIKIAANFDELHDLAIQSLYVYRLVCRFSGSSGNSILHLIKEFQRIEKFHDSAVCMQRYANIALERFDYDSASEFYHKAQSIFSDLQDIKNKANCLEGIGEIALANRQYEEAKLLFCKALKLNKIEKYTLGQANCLLGLANSYFHQNDFDRAERFYEISRRKFGRANSDLGQAHCLSGLAKCYFKASKFSTARTFIISAANSFNELGDSLSRARSLILAATIELNEQNKPTAQIYAEEAKMIFDRHSIENYNAELNKIFGQIRNDDQFNFR